MSAENWDGPGFPAVVTRVTRLETAATIRAMVKHLGWRRERPLWYRALRQRGSLRL